MVLAVLRHELGYSDEQRSSWRVGQLDRDQVQVCIRQCTVPVLRIPSTVFPTRHLRLGIWGLFNDPSVFFSSTRKRQRMKQSRGYCLSCMQCQYVCAWLSMSSHYAWLPYCS